MDSKKHARFRTGSSTDQWAGKRGKFSRDQRLLILLTFLLALFFRILRLDFNSLWNDELSLLVVIQKSWADMLDMVSQYHTNPAIYFSLEKLVLTLFGDGEWALRILSAICSALTVALGVAVALRLRLKSASVVALAFCLSLNMGLIYYGQDARPYALVAFLSALLLFLRLRWLEKLSQLDFIYYGLCGCLLMETHYVSALFFGSLLLADVFTVGRKKPEWRMPLVGSCILLGLFVITLAVSTPMEDLAWVKELHLDVMDIIRFFTGLPVSGGPRVGYRFFVDSTLLLLVLTSPVFFWKASREKRMTFLGMYAGVFLPLLTAQITQNLPVLLLMDRYFIFAIVPYWILLIYAIESLPTFPKVKRLSLAGLIFLQALSLFAGEKYYFRTTKEDWRGIAQSLQQEVAGGSHSVFVMCQGQGYYDYYLRRFEIANIPQWPSCVFSQKTIDEVLRKYPETQDLFFIHGHQVFHSDEFAISWPVENFKFLNQTGYQHLRRPPALSPASTRPVSRGGNARHKD
jgi:uncharacterized membrane protein